MKQKSEDAGSILRKEKFSFKTQKELEKYYEKKWATEGYEKGYKNFGINISKLNHKARHDTAFSLLNPQKNETILDVGCGDGTWDFRIAKKCKEVIAIDISSNAFKKSKAKAPKNLIFKKMNAESLDFPDNSFDKIYSVEALEHFINPEIALKEFRRVLKSEGVLVVSYPLIDKTIVSKLMLKLHLMKPWPVSEHLTDWDYNKVISKVSSAGFKLDKLKGAVFDLGKLFSLKKYFRCLVMPITNLSTSLSCFPRNSLFLIAKFKKVS